MTDDTIEDLLFEIAKTDYSLCFDDKRAIENKNGIILAANGILMGFIASATNILNSLSVSLCIILFGLSSVFCVFAIDFHEYKYLTAMDTWAALKKRDILSDLAQSKMNISATIHSATIFNRERVDQMVKWTKKAIQSFVVGLIVLVCSVILIFIKI